jgi:hypothetical protein
MAFRLILMNPAAVVSDDFIGHLTLIAVQTFYCIGNIKNAVIKMSKHSAKRRTSGLL